jgi:hypothetical protein
LPIQHGHIRGYQRLGSRKLAEFQKNYRNLKWIIIDEISMVSYQTFRMIHLRLCEIFGTDGTEPFAGKNVLIMGDLFQLPPVRATKIYKQPRDLSAEVNLWREFEFNELTINMRQTNDPLAAICSELRFGNLSEDSLKLLKSRLLAKPGRPGLSDADWFDAVRVVPEIADCTSFNRRMTLTLKSTQQTFKIKAYDMFGEGVRQGQRCPDSLIPTKENQTAGIPGTLELGIGSRVMLRRNLSLTKGHVNGATGVVTRIDWTINRDRQISPGDLPKRVWVRFDHESFETAIEPCNADFYGKRQTRVTRRMVPLILAWAITCHKLQGATLNKAVVYLGTKCRTKGLAYVAISRVRTLNGLAISELDPRQLLRTNKFSPADDEAIKEVDRLRAQAHNFPFAQDLNMHLLHIY